MAELADRGYVDGSMATVTDLWHRRPDLGPAGRRVATVLVRAYFDVSYGLLGSEAGRQLLRHAAAGGEPVHGYLTIDDRDQLVAVLDPRPGDRLLDLGSGPGGVALEIHRRTGAEIVGIDLAPRAIASANQRAEGAGVGGAVTFTTGILSRPPHVGARNAYAIDSLMFLPDLTRAIRGIGEALEPGGRLFATLLVVGPSGRDRLRRSLRGADVEVERLEDVTVALGARSRRRATRATALLMLVVVSEEAIIRTMVATGWLSRWRFVIRYRDRGWAGILGPAAGRRATGPGDRTRRPGSPTHRCCPRWRWRHRNEGSAPSARPARPATLRTGRAPSRRQ